MAQIIIDSNIPDFQITLDVLKEFVLNNDKLFNTPLTDEDIPILLEDSSISFYENRAGKLKLKHFIDIQREYVGRYQGLVEVLSDIAKAENYLKSA